MSGFVDKLEQYIGNAENRALLWMFSGYGENNEVQRKILLLRLSSEEYEKFKFRTKDETVINVLESIYSNLSYPNTRVLLIDRLPHYSAVNVDLTISSSMSFDNVIQHMNSLVSGKSIEESKIHG